MTSPGPECAPDAQRNQARKVAHGLPPCGRLMDPSCRFMEDVSHAADLIEEGRRSLGRRPADDVDAAGLLARIHGIGTQVALESIERELRRRRDAHAKG